jgi:RimJ/RimL family protein N-acetyltransferase
VLENCPVEEVDEGGADAGSLDSFPEGFELRRALKNGQTVLIRPITAEDKAELARAFHSLSEETRRRRFHGVVTEPSEATLRYLTEVDQRNHVALVAVIESPDLKSEQGIGVARFIRTSEDPKVAEAAVTVVDAFQGQGVGRHLLTELARVARRLGVRHFRAEVLADNAPVKAILEVAGAKPQQTQDGATLYDVDLGSTVSQGTLFELFRTVAASMGSAMERVAQASARLGSVPREALAQALESANRLRAGELRSPAPTTEPAEHRDEPEGDES